MGLQSHHAMGGPLETVFILLQAVVVLFLWLHDFIPLGSLNNLGAIQREDTLQHRVVVTLLGALPASACLYYSIHDYGKDYPHSVALLLWITYGLFLVGLMRAWWVPYLLVPDAARATRYKTIFARTHRFLPERHGMAPDTLHTIFHVAVIATIFLLWLR